MAGQPLLKKSLRDRACAAIDLCDEQGNELFLILVKVIKTNCFGGFAASGSSLSARRGSGVSV